MLRHIAGFLLALLTAVTALAQTDDKPANWSGSVELPGGMKLDFSVSLTPSGGTISIPMQGVKDLPLSDVQVTPKQLKFGIKQAGAAWELQVADDGQSAQGVLKQGGEFKTTMKRLAEGESAVKELNRPQEPKAPFPYDAHEVTFENQADGISLAGTLTIPRGDGPFPCVVLVSGSGPQNRDELLLGHKPFLVLADHLTRHGIAVLRFDDRGVAQSQGVFLTATTDDFARDALAAVKFLAARSEINPHQIGIAGHSEGGIVAPMCAALSKDVAFIVLLAGTGMMGADLLPIQSRLISVATGTDEALAQAQAKESAAILKMVVAGAERGDVERAIREAAIREFKAAPETKDLPDDELTAKADAVVQQQSAALFTPWFKRFLTLDPRDYLRKVSCPVLAINGTLDLQVPPKDNLPLIEAALKQGGNTDVTIVELPHLNHLFQTCKTGSPTEYSEIEETFSPVALETVTNWIRKHTGLDK
ncbi:MAG: alpha/beta hydrolase family protein [Phycisphaerales bacterium]